MVGRRSDGTFAVVFDGGWDDLVRFEGWKSDPSGPVHRALPKLCGIRGTGNSSKGDSNGIEVGIILVGELEGNYWKL